MTKHTNSLPKRRLFFYAIRMDMQNLDLRPNCLITPSELIFVPGPRSLFFYKKPFGLLPEFLYEHGYRVQTLSLPFRNHTLRMYALKNWLTKHTLHSYHFIMDQSTFEEFEPLLNQSQIQSLTILTSDQNADLKSAANQKSYLFTLPESASKIPISYRLHELFNWVYRTKTSAFETTFSDFNRQQYDRFLDHCVKLAENELYA